MNDMWAVVNEVYILCTILHLFLEVLYSRLMMVQIAPETYS